MTSKLSFTTTISRGLSHEWFWGLSGCLQESSVWIARWKTQSFNPLFWLYKAQISDFSLLPLTGLNITRNDDHLLSTWHVGDSDSPFLTTKRIIICLSIKSDWCGSWSVWTETFKLFQITGLFDSLKSWSNGSRNSLVFLWRVFEDSGNNSCWHMMKKNFHKLECTSWTVRNVIYDAIREADLIIKWYSASISHFPNLWA